MTLDDLPKKGQPGLPLDRKPRQRISRPGSAPRRQLWRRPLAPPGSLTATWMKSRDCRRPGHQPDRDLRQPRSVTRSFQVPFVRCKATCTRRRMNSADPGAARHPQLPEKHKLAKTSGNSLAGLPEEIPTRIPKPIAH